MSSGGRRGGGGGGGGGGAVHGKHTLMFVQLRGKNTRTYFDYNNEAAALNELIKMFEQRLFELNPSQPYLSYEPGDVSTFIDSLPHVGLLVYEAGISAYVPYDKAAIKRRVEQQLRARAQ